MCKFKKLQVKKYYEITNLTLTLANKTQQKVFRLLCLFNTRHIHQVRPQLKYIKVHDFLFNQHNRRFKHTTLSYYKLNTLLSYYWTKYFNPIYKGKATVSNFQQMTHPNIWSVSKLKINTARILDVNTIREFGEYRNKNHNQPCILDKIEQIPNQQLIQVGNILPYIWLHSIILQLT